MQPVLLVNPTGGHKHAYHPDELKADLEHGWEVVDLADVPEPMKVTAAEVIADAAAQIGADLAGDELKALNQAIKRKPGRPPKAK